MTGQPLITLSIGFSLLAVGGCGVSAVDVRYPEAAAHRAMLASAPPQRVAIPPVADRRMDTARIGFRPKGDGDIVTSRPVADIVGEALAIEIGKNGHAVVRDGADVVLSAGVEAFWLDMIRTYPGTQYVGRVVIALTVVDGRRGTMLLSRRYIGIKRQQVDKASERDWRQVMDAALARTMHDLGTDAALVSVLARAPTIYGLRLGSAQESAARACTASPPDVRPRSTRWVLDRASLEAT